jgi:hypothetical protein
LESRLPPVSAIPPELPGPGRIDDYNPSGDPVVPISCMQTHRGGCSRPVPARTFPGQPAGLARPRARQVRTLRSLAVREKCESVLDAGVLLLRRTPGATSRRTESPGNPLVRFDNPTVPRKPAYRLARQVEPGPLRESRTPTPENHCPSSVRPAVAPPRVGEGHGRP